MDSSADDSAVNKSSASAAALLPLLIGLFGGWKKLTGELNMSAICLARVRGRTAALVVMRLVELAAVINGALLAFATVYGHWRRMSSSIVCRHQSSTFHSACSPLLPLSPLR